MKSFASDTLAVFSDLNQDIFLNFDPTSRLGFIVFVPDLGLVESRLSKSHPIMSIENGFRTVDPNGIPILLRSMDTLPEIDRSEVTEKNMCGNYFGIGIESMKFEETINFWNLFGYTSKNEYDGSAGYFIMNKINGSDLTLFQPGTCPHAFYNPSLTYFNGKEGNPIVIANLRKAGVHIAEEITVFNSLGEVDNIIIRDPGGLHAFIFNDG